MTGRLIVVTGPSGVGKDTVLAELFRLDPSLRYSVSYTTRPPREGEVEGDAYRFVDAATFQAMIDRDQFLEWSDVYGHRYGRTGASIERDLESGAGIIVKIDVQGAAKIRARMGSRPTYVFLVPPSLGALEQRLTDRATEDEASLRARRDRASAELAEKETYDHRVVNDGVGRAAREILDIIAADRARAIGAGEHG